MFRLRVQSPYGILRYALSEEAELVLGAGPGCDLVLPYRGVSKTHARVKVVDTSAILEDLGSKNGLFVNGASVQAHQLAPGEAPVQIGEVYVGLEKVSSSDELIVIPIGEEVDADQGKITIARSQELDPPPGMVLGNSAAIRGLLEQIRATVNSWLDVLLLGETGTGKELFARMIHRSGPTSDGPFVAINCAAIPRELLEAELFGVERRVATGVDPRPGHFVEADGGTIFLDEIAEMPGALQVKLLRAVQEREVLPVGSSNPKPFKVRIVAASNQRIPTLVREKRFRADLYYRLRGLQFHIPPLRDRREDIPDLLEHFVTESAEEYEKRIRGVSRRALRILMEYPWPGNVRELKREVERAVLVCPDGGVLESSHFAPIKWAREHSASGTFRFRMPGESPEVPVAAADAEAAGGEVSPKPAQEAAAEPSSGNEGEFRPLQERIEEIERRAIRQALDKTGGNKSAAARLLGISRNGLALKMERLGIEG